MRWHDEFQNTVRGRGGGLAGAWRVQTGGGGRTGRQAAFEGVSTQRNRMLPPLPMNFDYFLPEGQEEINLIRFLTGNEA